VEPWQVLVKASEAGLSVTKVSQGEDKTDGLYLGVRLFGYMPAWEEFTAAGYTVTDEDVILLGEVARVLGIHDETTVGAHVEGLIARLSNKEDEK
jgi:hypothetical protein